MDSFLVFLVFSVLSGTQSLNNGLARTPQMGWNSWNHFHCGVNDSVIRGAADAMVSNHFVWFAWILAIVSWLYEDK